MLWACLVVWPYFCMECMLSIYWISNISIQKKIDRDEGSILFSEILTDFERIKNHALNIANDMLNMEISGK